MVKWAWLVQWAMNTQAKQNVGHIGTDSQVQAGIKAWDEIERGQPESILDRPTPTEVLDEGVWNVAWQEHISALGSKDSELKLKCKAALLKASVEWVHTDRRKRMLELDINRLEQKQWLEQKRFEEKYEIVSQ